MVHQLHQNPAFSVSFLGSVTLTPLINAAVIPVFYAVEKVTEQLPADWRTISYIAIGLSTLASIIAEYKALEREKVSINAATNAINLVTLKPIFSMLLSQAAGILIFFNPINPAETITVLGTSAVGGGDMLLKYIAVHHVINDLYNTMCNMAIARGDQEKIIRASKMLGSMVASIRKAVGRNK